jgi:hypothetical protein
MDPSGTRNLRQHAPIGTSGDGRLLPSLSAQSRHHTVKPPYGQLGTSLLAVFGALIVAMTWAMMSSPVGLKSRALSGSSPEEFPYTYSVSLVGVHSRAQTVTPLFGFGGVLHLRHALDQLGARLSSCARAELPNWGAPRFGLRIQQGRTAFVVVSLPQHGSDSVQEELRCIRSHIEAAELPHLRQLPPPQHQDYLIQVVVTRALMGASPILEPLSSSN